MGFDKDMARQHREDGVTRRTSYGGRFGIPRVYRCLVFTH